MFVTRPWRNWIAHLIPNQKVVGSIPVGRAIRKGFDLKGQSLFSYQQFQPVRQQFQTNLIGLPFDLTVGMDPYRPVSRDFGIFCPAQMEAGIIHMCTAVGFRNDPEEVHPGNMIAKAEVDKVMLSQEASRLLFHQVQVQVQGAAFPAVFPHERR